jgi:hypothetical protein
MPSPSLMDSVGHSGTQAPQAMQSSVIFIVMVVTPSKIYCYAYKINPCPRLRQLTNIFYLVKFVTIPDQETERVVNPPELMPSSTVL